MWGAAASAAGRLGTPAVSTATACVLLWRVDGGGGLLLEAHAVLLHRLQLLSWVCSATIVEPWVLTDSWVAAYAAPKLAIVSPYDATVSSSLTAAIP